MTNEEFIKVVSFGGEEWKDVIGYEGYYMVSSFGRIISLGRMIPPGRGGITERCKSPQLIHPAPNPKGYYKCALCKNGKVYNARIHKIVAEAFIPNPNNYKYIDHIDTNTKNNKVSNLRWCTLKMNQNNPLSLIKMSKAHIKRCKEGRMYVRPVVRISLNNNNDIKIYESIKNASNDGFLHQSISKCCLKQMHKHRGYRWMYLSDYETLINKSKNSTIQKDND